MKGHWGALMLSQPNVPHVEAGVSKEQLDSLAENAHRCTPWPGPRGHEVDSGRLRR